MGNFLDFLDHDDEGFGKVLEFVHQSYLNGKVFV